MVRHRQPPAGLDLEGRELVTAPGSATPRVARRRRAPAARDLDAEVTVLKASGISRSGSCSSRPAPGRSCAGTRAPRRRHPLSSEGEGLGEAIDARASRRSSRSSGWPTSSSTTTSLNVHDLSARITELFGEDDLDPRHADSCDVVRVHARDPHDVDLVLDCRFLPNPHWVEELRPLDRSAGAGPRLRAGAGRRRAVPRHRPDDCWSCSSRPTCAEGKSVPLGGVRLHRRPAPLGRASPGRRGSRAQAWFRADGRPP